MCKKVLIVHGGWEGHEPEKCVAIIAPALEAAGVTVTLSETLAALDSAESLGAYDAIVPAWTMGELTPRQEASLVEAVKAGAGIGGWHGGMGDAFRTASEFQFMVGGQFVAHPGGLVDYGVEVVDRDHSVMDGVDDFAVHSEQYYMHVDPSNRVLAVTTFGGEHCAWIDRCRMPVAWTRHYGLGRVFYCSLGHVASELESTEVKGIITRGILWAAGRLD